MSRLENNHHNHELLSDLFEVVYNTLKDARGTRHTLGTDEYLDPAKVRVVVEQAIRKFELEAFDEFRNNL